MIPAMLSGRLPNARRLVSDRFADCYHDVEFS